MKIIKSQLVLIMAAIIAVSVLCQCSNNTNQKFLEASVKEINKKLPQTLDANTRFDKCEALPNQTLKANYTVFSDSGAKIDSSAFRAKMTAGLIYNTHNNIELKPLRDRSVNFLYSYKDENGNLVCEILVTPANYNKGQAQPKPFNIEDVMLNDAIGVDAIK